MKNQLFFRGNRKRQSRMLGGVFLSLFMLVAVFIAACDKEAPIAVDKQAGKEKEMAQALPDPAIQQELMKPVTTQYLYQGKVIEKEEFENLSKSSAPLFTVTVAAQSDRHVALVFDSEEALYSWAAKTEFAAKFAQLRKVIAEARQNKGTDMNFSVGKLTGETKENLALTNRRDAITFYAISPFFAFREFKPLPVRLHDLRAQRYNGDKLNMNDNIVAYKATTLESEPYPIVVVFFQHINFEGEYEIQVGKGIDYGSPPYEFARIVKKVGVSSLIAI